jgi:hypothetical protein
MASTGARTVTAAVSVRATGSLVCLSVGRLTRTTVTVGVTVTGTVSDRPARLKEPLQPVIPS